MKALAAAIAPFTSRDCSHCRKALKDMAKEGWNRNYYGTRHLDGDFVNGYILRPDRNEQGFITHYHICREE